MDGDDTQSHHLDCIESPLHVGVVAYEMEGLRSGVGRYLEGLLRGLQTESPTDWRWTLFFRGDPFKSDLFTAISSGSSSGDPSQTSSGDPSQKIRAVFDGRSGWRPIPWEQLRLPWILRHHRLDFLFSPAYSLPPFAGVPRMLTLHDLSFEHLPEEFSWRERWRRRILARQAAARAERVLTDTRRVADEIRQTYGVPSGQIGVVPLAVGERFFAAASSSEAERSELGRLGVRAPYLLHLGSILPRRQIHLTLEAFTRFSAEQDDVQMVIAGSDRLPDGGELERHIVASGVSDRIVRVSWVPEGLLVPLYRHAVASVYLSRYEGYGLPPLESLASGTPAIVNAGTALDELWPDYPFLVERNAQDVADAMRRTLDGPDTGFREQARQVVGQLDWRASARQLVDEICSAMAEAR